MEFRDLKQQYQALKPEIDCAMIAVAESGAFISGAPVAELEKTLAADVGVKHCITCGNGTDALTMVMMAWGIKAGDAVFVPDFTFFASGEIVAHAGATPIFVDVDQETFNLSPAKLEEMIERVKQEGTLTPKAIIAVDLFGLPADFCAIEAIAKKHGLLVLEDGAQGFGGEIKGKQACSFGHAATTSFFPAKPLGCYGDGGAIFTDDAHTAKLLQSIRVHGKGETKYDNARIGLNSRLDTLQAAILQIKHRAFRNGELAVVNQAAAQYTAELQDVVRTPVIPQGYGSAWAQYTIRLETPQRRDALQAHLRSQNIPSMVYYPKPMHCQEAFAGQTFAEADYKTATRLTQTVLSLPMHPYLQEADIQTVVKAVKQGLG